MATHTVSNLGGCLFPLVLLCSFTVSRSGTETGPAVQQTAFWNWRDYTSSIAKVASPPIIHDTHGPSDVRPYLPSPASEPSSYRRAQASAFMGAYLFSGYHTSFTSNVRYDSSFHGHLDFGASLSVYIPISTTSLTISSDAWGGQSIQASFTMNTSHGQNKGVMPFDKLSFMRPHLPSGVFFAAVELDQSALSVMSGAVIMAINLALNTNFQIMLGFSHIGTDHVIRTFSAADYFYPASTGIAGMQTVQVTDASYLNTNVDIFVANDQAISGIFPKQIQASGQVLKAGYLYLSIAYQDGAGAIKSIWENMGPISGSLPTEAPAIPARTMCNGVTVNQHITSGGFISCSTTTCAPYVYMLAKPSSPTCTPMVATSPSVTVNSSRRFTCGGTTATWSSFSDSTCSTLLTSSKIMVSRCQPFHGTALAVKIGCSAGNGVDSLVYRLFSDRACSVPWAISCASTTAGPAVTYASGAAQDHAFSFGLAMVMMTTANHV